MSDDNNFTLGDILWEYADYTPPESTVTDYVPKPPDAIAPSRPSGTPMLKPARLSPQRFMAGGHSASGEVPPGTAPPRMTSSPGQAPSAGSPPSAAPAAPAGVVAGEPAPVGLGSPPGPVAPTVPTTRTMPTAPTAPTGQPAPAAPTGQTIPAAPTAPAAPTTQTIPTTPTTPAAPPDQTAPAAPMEKPGPTGEPEAAAPAPDPSAGQAPSQEPSQEPSQAPSAGQPTQAAGRAPAAPPSGGTPLTEEELKAAAAKAQEEAAASASEEAAAPLTETEGEGTQEADTQTAGTPPESQTDTTPDAPQPGVQGQPGTSPIPPRQRPPEQGKSVQTGTAGVHAPRRERKPRPAPEVPPDATPAQLMEEYGQGLGSQKSRCITSAILTGGLLLLSLLESGLVLPVKDWVPEQVFLAAGFVLFALVGWLCWDVLEDGLVQLTNKTPNQNTLALFAAFFTVIDGLTLLVFHLRESTVPLFAPCSLVLTCHAMGRYFLQSARYGASRSAAAVAQPYLVTQDANLLQGQTAFRKWLGPVKGFGSQLRTLSEGEFRFQRLTPVLLIACVVFSLLTTVVHKQANLVFWSLAALFCASSTLGASMTLSLPWKVLSKRLEKNGVALAGWPGLVAGKGGKSAILGDYDFYPPGSVTIRQAQHFGQWSMERATACAASVIRASGSGLTYLFDRTLKAQNGAYLAIERLVIQENGLMGYTPQGQLILVGDGEFMGRQAIALPQGVKGKDTLFCAVGGEMAGLFVLQYTLHPTITPALNALLLNGIHPVVATRDYHITPSRLRLRAYLSLKKLTYPELQRRVDLSGTKQPHSNALVAIICREGLPPYTEALVGARRLRRAGKLSSWLVNISACVGVFLAAFLSSSGALSAMCAWNLSLYLLLWLAPIVLLALWARQF